MDQIQQFLQAHCGIIWAAIGSFALRHFGPELWNWASTTGTDEAVHKAKDFLVGALKKHGATDQEINRIIDGISQILYRVATDVKR